LDKNAYEKIWFKMGKIEMSTANRNAGGSEINPKGDICLGCLLLKEAMKFLTQYPWIVLR